MTLFMFCGKSLEAFTPFVEIKPYFHYRVSSRLVAQCADRSQCVYKAIFLLICENTSIFIFYGKGLGYSAHLSKQRRILKR